MKSPVRVAIVAAALALILNVILRKTAMGRRFSAVGANPRSAWIAGINVAAYQAAAFTVAALLYGVAGILISAFIRNLTRGVMAAARPTTDPGWILRVLDDFAARVSLAGHGANEARVRLHSPVAIGAAVVCKDRIDPGEQLIDVGRRDWRLDRRLGSNQDAQGQSHPAGQSKCGKRAQERSFQSAAHAAHYSDTRLPPYAAFLTKLVHEVTSVARPAPSSDRCTPRHRDSTDMVAGWWIFAQARRVQHFVNQDDFSVKLILQVFAREMSAAHVDHGMARRRKGDRRAGSSATRIVVSVHEPE